MSMKILKQYMSNASFLWLIGAWTSPWQLLVEPPSKAVSGKEFVDGVAKIDGFFLSCQCKLDEMLALCWIPFSVQKSWCPCHGLADLSPGWIPLMDTRDGFRWVQQIVSWSSVLGCTPNSLPIKKTEQFVLIIFDYVERKIQCRLRISKKKYHTCSSGLATTCNIMWLLWDLFMIWIKEPLLLKVLEGFALAKMGLDVIQNLWTLGNWLTHNYDFRWCNSDVCNIM